jgi:anti-anti-sigma factor
MEQGLRIIDRSEETVVVVDRADGFETGPRLRACLYRLADEAGGAGGPVVVDLSQLNLIDAAVLGALEAAAKRLRSRGRPLVLESPPPQAQKALVLTGLARQLTVR